jgi:hypothetical protein
MLKATKLLYLTLLCACPFAASAQTPADTVCLGDTSIVKYYVSNPETGVQYTWALNEGGTVASETNDTLFVKWGTVPGLYRISINSVNSFGCAGEEAEYWILLQEAPPLNLKPANPNICEGQSVTIRASGADTYIWSPAEGLNTTDADTAIASPETTITYTVTGFLGSCQASKTITVETTDRPNASFLFEQTGNYFLQFTNTSSGASSYFWDFGPDNTSTEENPLAEFPFDGPYTITLIAENGCGRDTLTQTIEVIKLGFSDITGTKVQIGPNPVQDQAMLQLTMLRPEVLHYKLFNILGQELSEDHIQGKSELLVPIDFSSYARGIYYLQLNQGIEQITIRLVKQ